MKQFFPQKEWMQFWKKRKKTTHKGENGRVLVIGGSEAYAGAPILSSVGALRSGADLVTLAAPARVVCSANAYCPDILGKNTNNYITDGDVHSLKKMGFVSDAVLIGNGLSQKSIPSIRKLISYFIQNNVPLVLDATSFDALQKMNNEKLDNCILLPHPKEFERWTGINVTEKNSSERKKILNEIIGKKRMVINLKDNQSVIASPHFSYVNKTGNQGMTKGGFGDVLAGVTAGLWAQGMGAFASASCAAWLNGKMSGQQKQKKWFGYIASDLLESIRDWKK